MNGEGQYGRGHRALLPYFPASRATSASVQRRNPPWERADGLTVELPCPRETRVSVCPQGAGVPPGISYLPHLPDP